MVEKDFNSLFQKVVNDHPDGFAYKIPDPPKASISVSAKRPYDIIGAFNGKVLGIENKLIKSEFGAFNLSRLEEHQIPKLVETYTASKDDSYIGAGICWWQSRKLYSFFYFPITTLLWMQQNQIQSIPKKILVQLRDQHEIVVAKKTFDIESLPAKAITPKVLSNFF